MQPQFGTEGGRRFPRKADDREAVGAVGGNLEFHYVIVHTDDGANIVARLNPFLVKHKDAVRNTMREFGLLRMEIVQRADGISFGVISHQIPNVKVLAARVRSGSASAEIQADVITAIRLGLAFQHPGRRDRTENLLSGLDISRNRRFGRIQRLVVIEKGRCRHSGIGEVADVKIQLPERAEHPPGLYAAQVAAGDMDAAGQPGIVFGDGHQIARMDILRAGNDLYRLVRANIYLADPHMV